MKSNPFIVHRAHAFRVLDTLMAQFFSGGYPYNLKGSMLEQLVLPKRLTRGGEEEARWWFFCCMLMRGGINSDVALKALSEVYDQHEVPSGLRPFSPYVVRSMEIDTLSGLLSAAGTGLYRHSRDWIAAAELMYSRYNGQVLAMLSEISDYPSAVRVLRNHKGAGFPGFQHKMVSMLLFFMVEAGLLEYFPYPPPVDFHLQRIASATGMVSRKGGGEILVKSAEFDLFDDLLRRLYLSYIQSRGISSNQLADALWLHSRTLCVDNPGNRAYRKKGKGRSRPIVVHTPNWFGDRKTDIEKFDRSCGQCVIAEHCRWNVPSAFRYVQGVIRLAGERQASPHLTFNFDID